MSEPAPEVVYVLPDKLGGVFNYVRNLLEHRAEDGWRYASVVTDNAADPDTRSDEELPADRSARVRYELPPENVHAVLRRLAQAIPTGPGVLVANDWIELALATVHDTGKVVVAIAHGDFDYYYDLARRHESTVDAFVTYTSRIASRLADTVPHRADSIVLLPYGVAIPAGTRRVAAGPLRLLYVGRLNRHKGVLDLPLIDAELRSRGVAVSWTVQGAGPDEQALRTMWQTNPAIRFSGRRPMADVLRLYQDHDVLVMPSRNEGLPVALLEAGAAGVVPVVSNLASGVPDVVEPGVTGFRPEPGDIRGFVEAISQLAADRGRLEELSAAVRRVVSDRYDADRCTREYQRLYHDLAARRRPFRRRKLPYGSRLDKPWIPNAVVRAIRSATRPATERVR